MAMSEGDAGKPGAAQPASVDGGDTENRCTTCGRYVGPITLCPFCGATIKRRRGIAITKWGALAIAVVGMLLLHGYAAYYGTPPMDIENLDETTNYAYVELNGVVVSAPVYYPGTDGAPGTIYFTVDDGTGQISVRAYPQPVVEEMLESGNVPGYGDRVKLTGNVYWYNAERGFILNDLNQLEITRPSPTNMTVGKIAATDPATMVGYYRVRTWGVVSSWRKYFSSVDVSLQDADGNEISLYVPSSVTDLTGVGALGQLEVGMGLDVTGCLEYYDAGSYSKWEIIPATMSDVAVAQPDLSVTAIESSPLAFPLNQQFTLNITVSNVGHLPVSDAVLRLEFDGAPERNLTISSVGEMATYMISYDAVIADGRTSLTVTATVVTAQLDSDESDNQMTRVWGG
jgi:hypothetical protein